MANNIVLIAKDEDEFIIDFLVHHLFIGADRIIIIDDLSKQPILDLLSNLPKQLKDRATVFRPNSEFYSWSLTTSDSLFDKVLFEKYSNSKQMYFYNFVICKVLQSEDWCAFIDADEFIWPGIYKNLMGIRSALEAKGFKAIIFDQILFGHGFNIVPPMDKNIASFLWCSENLYGHGKYFVNVDSIVQIDNAHYPKIKDQKLIADFTLSVRESEFSKPRIDMAELRNTVHLKHFIIQDVVSCFKRRSRPRISAGGKVTAADVSWKDRILMLEWTCRITNFDLVGLLINSKIELGVEVDAIVRSFATSLSKINQFDHVSGSIDFSYLREKMDIKAELDDAVVMFKFFQLESPDLSWLRFKTVPYDFEPLTYQKLNMDLESMNSRELIRHYLEYGVREKRRFK